MPCNIPEEWTPQLHCGSILKHYNLFFFRQQHVWSSNGHHQACVLSCTELKSKTKMRTLKNWITTKCVKCMLGQKQGFQFYTNTWTKCGYFSPSNHKNIVCIIWGLCDHLTCKCIVHCWYIVTVINIFINITYCFIFTHACPCKL